MRSAPVRRCRQRVPAVGVALLALAASGCGSSAVPAPDPASLVPANAPLYVSAVVRPNGALRALALADGRALTHQSNPYTALLGALSLRGPSGHVSFAQVKPWLGERAGLFLTASGISSARTPATLLAMLRRASSGQLFARAASGGGGPPVPQAQGAVVVAVTNVRRARAFLRSQLPAGSQSGRGLGTTTWWQGAEGQAATIVGHFLVVGSEAGVKNVIETADGAPSLLHASGYAGMRAGAPAKALAEAYVNLPATAPAVARSTTTGRAATKARSSRSAGRRRAGTGVATGSVEEAGGAASATTGEAAGGESAGGEGSVGGEAASAAEAPLGRALGLLGGRQLYLSLVPQSGQLRLQIDAVGASRSPSAGESERAATAEQMLQQLPESSWLATGLASPLADAERAAPLLAALMGARPQAGGARASSPGPFRALAQSMAALGRALGPPLSGDLAPFERIARALAPHTALLQRQLASWAGPAALFISGASLLETSGGVVVNASEPAAARAAVGLLARMLKSAGIAVEPVTVPGAETAVSVALNGLPVQVPLEIAYGQGRFVAGLGVSPVQDALSPSGTLVGSQEYRSAAAGLGEGLQPRVILEFPQLLSLMGLLGASSNHTLGQLMPYLHSLTTLTAGVRPLGSGRRTIVVVGLQ